MKLNYKRTFFIGFAFMSICAFWQLYDGIIPLMLKNTFGLGETVTGVIMAADNVLALIMLPLFGALSDRIKTPLGKRTPFILCGTVAASVLMILIPVADLRANFVLFFISLGLVLVAMGTYRSPAVALMPDLTPKPLRSQANAVINLMGALGGIYSLAMISFLVGEDGDYLPVFISVMALMIIAVALLLLTIRENKLAAELPEEDREIKEKADAKDAPVKLSAPVFASLAFLLASVFFWFTAYNAVTTAYSRYVQNVWGQGGGSFASTMMVGTAAAVCSYIPVGIISSKLGRKRVILGGVALMTVSYALAATLSDYSPLMFVILILIGIGWAAINVNSYPMVVEMSRGSNIGKYTGVYYTFSMAAQIITPVLSGFLIEYTSLQYRVLFPYAAAFSALSFVTMLFVRHGDSRPPKKEKLIESFDNDD